MNKLTIIASFAILLSGCASIIKGTEDRVNIISSKGSSIYVDGVRVGEETGTASIKKGKPATIKVEKAGCKPTLTKTGERFDATSLLGILIDFGIISIPIDLISGAAWKVEPTIYNIEPDCA